MADEWRFAQIKGKKNARLNNRQSETVAEWTPEFDQIILAKLENS